MAGRCANLSLLEISSGWGSVILMSGKTCLAFSNLLVDPEYPDELHGLHNNYPLAPSSKHSLATFT